MSNAASDASSKAASRRRATGVKEVDEAFERIKAARKVARDELKALRKQYKKDLGERFGTHMALGMHDRLHIGCFCHRDRNS